MPVYEYRCGRCGPFEEFHRMSQANTTARCPDCADASLRVFTAPALVGGAVVGRGAGRRTRDQVDRAISGEPTITGAPVGRRLPAGRHAH